ncbi:MAG TPA: CRISPR system precrRNA processing endoribonuclease RAMP protein Cas6 [Anaerolineae bacterium]|nr:CRISPR system precrRNA processing endoribonuclease RAMP protein Cas6 [Anaerolineae bacterium]
MPYSITLSLKPIRTLPHSGGIPHRALNALLYHWLEAADPRLSAFVHEQAEPKPFTLSPLVEEGGGRYRFRVTLLEDEYGPYVSKGMEQERTVRVGSKILAIDGEATVEHRTYADIAQPAGTSPVITLRFDSPTAFKTRGMHYPLPDPILVFASYHARWNAFAPAEFHIDESWSEWLAGSGAVSRFALRSETLDFGEYRHVGCTGVIQFTVTARGPEANAGRGPLNALADYAYFCGTGHKTTQGLGQTRRLPGWPEEETKPSALES